MGMPTKLKILLTWFMLLATSFILFGCTSSSQDTAASGDVGRVVVLLTDCPTAEFDEVNVTIQEVTLLSDEGQVTIFASEEGKKYNLLDLAGEFQVFDIAEEVPVGWYNKIRLLVNEVELVKIGTGEGGENEIFIPKLPGNGKIDLVPGEPFHVGANKTLSIKLDMDVKKSIHINKKLGREKIIFRPVIFVEIISDTPPAEPPTMDKLIRVRGMVQEKLEESFTLCPPTLPAAAVLTDTLLDACVEVMVGEETAFFDDTGEVVEFAELAEGDEAVVVGKMPADQPDVQDANNALQPIRIDALVVEVGPKGTFLRLKGTVTSQPERSPDTTAVFGLEIAPGQGITGDLNVNVWLSEGTKIFSTAGDLLAIADLVDAVGSTATIDGILFLADVEGDPNVVKAALVVVDIVPEGMAELHGTIAQINPDQTLLVTCNGDQDLCLDLEEVCLTISNESHLFALSEIDETIVVNRVLVDELAPDDKVTAFVMTGETDCLMTRDLFVINIVDE